MPNSAAFKRRGVFKIVGHTSEVALDLQGDGWAGLYEAAGRGLLALYGLAEGGPATEDRRLAVDGADGEDVLVSWLNELIFLIGSRRWVPARLRVLEASDRRAEAALEGGPLGGRTLEKEIKAATFGGLRIRGARRVGLRARVILDV